MEIPVLGVVRVRARPEGAVYRVRRVTDMPSLVPIDADGLLPSSQIQAETAQES